MLKNIFRKIIFFLKNYFVENILRLKKFYVETNGALYVIFIFIYDDCVGSNMQALCFIALLVFLVFLSFFLSFFFLNYHSFTHCLYKIPHVTLNHLKQ